MGKDGKDGKDGNDGKDGKDGKDGTGICLFFLSASLLGSKKSRRETVWFSYVMMRIYRQVMNSVPGELHQSSCFLVPASWEARHCCHIIVCYYQHECGVGWTSSTVGCHAKNPNPKVRLNPAWYVYG